MSLRLSMRAFPICCSVLPCAPLPNCRGNAGYVPHAALRTRKVDNAHYSSEVKACAYKPFWPHPMCVVHALLTVHVE
jgi:hypothetical protein